MNAKNVVKCFTFLILAAARSLSCWSTGELSLGLETTEWSPMMNLELAERRAVETKQPVVVVSAA